MKDGLVHLGRTHPLVSALAGHTLDEALDPTAIDSPARRCGVIRTAAVDARTTLLLCRFRLNLTTSSRGEGSSAMLAEDAGVLAFTGSPESQPGSRPPSPSRFWVRRQAAMSTLIRHAIFLPGRSKGCLSLNLSLRPWHSTGRAGWKCSS